MQESVLVRKETDQYWTDNQEDYVYDLTNESFYRSLFPKATKIGYYDTKFIDLLLSKNATDNDTYNEAVLKEKDK